MERSLFDSSMVTVSSWTYIYARDNLIARKLQIHINLINYTNKWTLKIGDAKAETILLTKRIMIARKTTLKVGEEGIVWKDYARHVGMILDSRSQTKENSTYTGRKKSTASTIKTLHWTELKLELHKMLIRPVFIYGAPIWNIIEKQNSQYTMEQGKPKQLHNTTNTAYIPTVWDFIIKLAKGFFEI